MTGKRTFGVIAIIIAMMTVIGFQSQAKAEGDNNYLVRGSWSLQFRISNNFTLSSFEGALISAKRHLSNNSAIRFGLSLSGSTGDISTDNIASRIDSLTNDTSNNSSDGELSDISVGATTQIMFYTTSDKKIDFYFGVGPDLSYTRSKRDYDLQYIQQDDPIRNGKDTDYSRTWTFGLLGSWGVEYFVTQKLSLMAEYGAGLGYYSRYRESKRTQFIDERTQTTLRTEEENRFRFYSSNVNFGLSVYFN